MLLAAGCGGGGQSADKDTSGAQGGKAQPVKVQSTEQSAYWTDSDDKAHPLTVAPKSLARGSASDLEKVRLDDGLKGMVPYYLTVSVTNEDSSTLESPSPERNLSLSTADGTAGKPVQVFSGGGLSTESPLPAGCRKGAPDKLAAKGKAELCQIFMLPKGQEPGSVAYADGDADPVVWKAGDGKGSAGVLPAGKPADSAWKNSSGKSVPVKVTPKNVREGEVSDLGKFDLDADDKKKVPYYVTFAYRNGGKDKLYPDMQDGVTLRTVSGQETRPLTLLDFSGSALPQCPKSKPDGMVAPKGTVTQCSVYLLPKSDRPLAVAFAGTGTGAQPLAWKAAPEKK